MNSGLKTNEEDSKCYTGLGFLEGGERLRESPNNVPMVSSAQSQVMEAAHWS